MFSSDPKKKAQQEQLAVVALGVVFVVAFMRGPAKSLGLFRHGAKAQPVAIDPSGVTVRPPIETLQQHQQQLDAVLEAAAGPATGQASASPKYSAQQLRNPFKSVIPELPPKPVVAQAPVPVIPPAPPPPPPALDIQGLLWGSDTPQAIISHRIYRVGDSILGMTILAIDYRGIRVDYHGESIVYPVSESPLRIQRAVGVMGSQQAQWR